jgi:hypothetical protein
MWISSAPTVKRGSRLMPTTRGTACRRLLKRADADLDAAVNLLVGAFDARYLSGEPISETWIERILAVVWTRNEAFPCARPA